LNKFLVLGSSGLIGKNLCNFLRTKNFTVLEYDIKNSDNEDLRKFENDELINLVNSCDFVFFLAFDVGGAKFLSQCKNDNIFLTNNTRIILNTFNLLKLTGKRFIFVSSYLVDNSYHSYGVLKNLGEHFTCSLGGLVVRLYNVYGLEEFSQRSHVITDFIYQARTSKCIKVMTDGLEERQFLYLDDCSEGLFAISQNYDEILIQGPIIQLTSFVWTSIREIAEIVASIVGCSVEYSNHIAEFVFKPIPNKLILKYWKPKIKIKEGIVELLKEAQLNNLQ
jgi:nucleoside-diphosphate-sugar epimerase